MKVSTPEARKFLREGAVAFARIEENGVRVDKGYLESAIIKTDNKIADMEKELFGKKLWTRWKKEFPDNPNLGSRDQLAHMAFTVLGFTPKAYTTTGRGKADKTAFEDIEHPFFEKLLRIEQLKKAKQTYLLGIQREMVRHGKNHWRVHPSYNLNTVITFRSSCDRPNFTNIPVRDFEIADLIRSCYIPSEGNLFAEIDYGMHEVIMIATYTKDPNLIKFATDPSKDMHRLIATKLFGIAPDRVSKLLRYIAKNGAVFPFFYGSASFLVAADVWKMIHILKAKTEDGILGRDLLAEQGITERGACVPGEAPIPGTFEARVKEVEKWFWSDKMFGVTARWKRDDYRRYQQEGGFWIKTGFRINGFHKRNEVGNYGAQGLGFHCLLKYIILMQKWLDKYKMKSMLVGEIHDSSLSDVTPGERDDYVNKAVEIMTEKVPQAWPFLTVPLRCEVELCEPGASWVTKKEHIYKGGTWVLKPK